MYFGLVEDILALNALLQLEHTCHSLAEML